MKVRRTAVLQEHLADAYMAANLILSDWSTDQPLLWDVDLQTAPLAQGQQIVQCPPDTIMVADAYVQTQASGFLTDNVGVPLVDESGALMANGSTQFANNRVIFPVGRSEFASYPNPFLQAPTTTYWFDRLISPVIHLYPVPDRNGPYVLFYWRFKKSQDATLAGGTQVAIPARWLMAYVDALAVELSYTYAPEMSAALTAKAAASYQRARIAEREVVSIYIAPGLASYYDR